MFLSKSHLLYVIRREFDFMGNDFMGPNGFSVKKNCNSVLEFSIESQEI